MKKYVSTQEILLSRIGFVSLCLLSHFAMVCKWQQATPRSNTRRPHQKDFWQNLGIDAMKKLRGLERDPAKSIAIGGEICAYVTVLKDGKNLYVTKDGTYFVVLQGEAVAV